ncbi:MAG: Na+/H+ antiporter NhaA [Hyphomicrobiaceae bacterium]
MASTIKKVRQGAIDFINHEASGGIILMMAAAVALVLANTPLAYLYDGLLSTPVSIRVGQLAIDKALLLWINDGLMAIFFFLVGLEIKREVLEGELSTFDQAVLPVIAAVGGMLMPALIYVAFNYQDAKALKGWAIPAATDIAFAVGVLALLGNRVPSSLKIFLLALAIIDDLGAIVIIALFYTSSLSVMSLGLAALGMLALFVLNMRGVNRVAAYVIIGVFIWVCVLKSGVHATLAGVAVALAVPLRTSDPEATPLLTRLEEALHPWVAFGVLPVFAFANAGVALGGLTFGSLLEPIPLGIALGLFLGKQIGIMGFVWIACMIGLARLPAGLNWTKVYGVSLLAGIGFTMSLFIGTLAFDSAEAARAIRIGVIVGSLLSAFAGYLLLRLALPAVANAQGSGKAA